MQWIGKICQDKIGWTCNDLEVSKNAEHVQLPQIHQSGSFAVVEALLLSMNDTTAQPGVLSIQSLLRFIASHCHKTIPDQSHLPCQDSFALMFIKLARIRMLLEYWRPMYSQLEVTTTWQPLPSYLWHHKVLVKRAMRIELIRLSRTPQAWSTFCLGRVAAVQQGCQVNMRSLPPLSSMLGKASQSGPSACHDKYSHRDCCATTPCLAVTPSPAK